MLIQKDIMPYNGQVAVLKCSQIWKKMRKSFKKLSEFKSSSSFPKKRFGHGKFSLHQLEKEPYFPYEKKLK